MDSKIERLISIVLNAAHSAREGAGYGGRWDDGGASHMEDQVKFYRYGQQSIVPPEWKEYEKLLDPEYQEYVRLQQKFGR
jgi:hypothetical protein